MVISGVEEGGNSEGFMATAPERSKPLHNFSMPHLKWGNQRFLRCMKVNSNGEISSTDRRSSASEAESDVLMRCLESEKRRSPSGFGGVRKSSPLPPTGASGVKSKIERDGDDGIEEIREKLMFHLRTAADKMKFAIPEEREGEESAAAAARPWNLRTRRAACKAPNENGGESSTLDEPQQKLSPPRTENPSPKSLRSRGITSSQGTEKNERRKFSIALTRKEIEEDFAMMSGTRPSRRPKKRPRIIQRHLDTLFPGLWLSEITADSYKIPDEPERKRSR